MLPGVVWALSMAKEKGSAPALPVRGPMMLAGDIQIRVSRLAIRRWANSNELPADRVRD